MFAHTHITHTYIIVKIPKNNFENLKMKINTNKRTYVHPHILNHFKNSENEFKEPPNTHKYQNLHTKDFVVIALLSLHYMRPKIY